MIHLAISYSNCRKSKKRKKIFRGDKKKNKQFTYRGGVNKRIISNFLEDMQARREYLKPPEGKNILT